MRESGEKVIEIASDILIPIRKVFDFLRGSAGIASYLLVYFVQIIMLNTLITFLDPIYFGQHIIPAGFN